MIKKWRFHELDAYHLNLGVPIVITLFLLLVNLEIFQIIFVEKMIELFKLYFYIALALLIFRLLLTRTQKTKKKILKLSMYEFGVFNSLLITIFLIINLNCSDKFYEQKYIVNRKLVFELETLAIKPTYLKVFKVRPKEYEDYFNKGFTLNVQINKSCFGYEFLESRTFEIIK